MASIGHVAVGLVAARACDPDPSTGSGQAARLAWPGMLAWSALSLLPDIDVVGFLRGVPYGAPWGHRGATHSLTLAVAGGIATGLAARGLGARWFRRPAPQIAILATIGALYAAGWLTVLRTGGAA